MKYMPLEFDLMFRHPNTEPPLKTPLEALGAMLDLVGFKLTAGEIQISSEERQVIKEALALHTKGIADV